MECGAARRFGCFKAGVQSKAAGTAALQNEPIRLGHLEVSFHICYNHNALRDSILATKGTLIGPSSKSLKVLRSISQEEGMR
jgi:hypothetical protein